MLYGVDSSERTSKSHLPVKLRYNPWTGLPMEGSIELEYQGQFITIEPVSYTHLDVYKRQLHTPSIEKL